MSEKREVSIRRAPKLPVFMIIGGAVGALATLIVTSLFPADKAIGFAATLGYFMLYGVPIGVALGAILGLILDRVASRRAKTVTVEREVVGDPPVIE
ncbi:MAG: potassium transporter Trk [Actinomycetota bacterium]|nr:potassium transporter Trk [Actinomycetota bacterium]